MEQSHLHVDQIGLELQVEVMLQVLHEGVPLFVMHHVTVEVVFGQYFLYHFLLSFPFLLLLLLYFLVFLLLGRLGSGLDQFGSDGTTLLPLDTRLDASLPVFQQHSQFGFFGNIGGSGEAIVGRQTIKLSILLSLCLLIIV